MRSQQRARPQAHYNAVMLLRNKQKLRCLSGFFQLACDLEIKNHQSAIEIPNPSACLCALVLNPHSSAWQPSSMPIQRDPRCAAEEDLQHSRHFSRCVRHPLFEPPYQNAQQRTGKIHGGQIQRDRRVAKPAL